MSCRKVVIESPYAGNIEANLEYARRCMRDSLIRGEHPIASHLLYTQAGILDDNDPLERALGIDAGLAWGLLADATVVYQDRGITPGMQIGIDRAEAAGRFVEYREIGPSARPGDCGPDGSCFCRTCTQIYGGADMRPEAWQIYLEREEPECVDCQIAQDQLDRQLGKDGDEDPSEGGR